MNKIKELIPYLIIIIIVVLIRTFFITPVVVQGTSMSPTLKGKEIMLLNKISIKLSEIKRFQIIVLKENNTYLIKRVIGLPKEKIKCVDGKIFINNKELVDPYGMGNTEDFNEIKIPENMYFVMGDNRVVSNDSRALGPIDKKELKGFANVVLYPFNNFGLVK